MPTVKSIMTTDLLTLEPEMTLRDAVELLGDEEVSGAPVVEGGRLVGVVSTTDLVEFQGSNPAIESPSRDEPTLGDQLAGASDWPEEDPSENPDAFFVDFWGQSGADAYQRLTHSDSPEWDLLAQHTVGEVMTRRIVSVEPDAELREVARIMTDRGVHRVLVTRNDHLEGIVTTTDLVRAIADGTLDG